MTAGYADAFEEGRAAREAFEAAQRAVHWSKAERGENLFCYECVSGYKDESAVLRYFQTRAEEKGRERMRLQQPELADRAEAGAATLAPEDQRATEERLQSLEQMVRDLGTMVRELQDTARGLQAENARLQGDYQEVLAGRRTEVEIVQQLCRHLERGSLEATAAARDGEHAEHAGRAER